MQTKISAPLKYPGAKWRIAPWILYHMPQHHSYCEPYFGSGAVFFNKSPSKIETINDLDSDVVNLFEVLRSYPEILIQAISFTPYSREEYDRAFSACSTKNEIEQARRFLVRCWQGHSFRTNQYKVGWRNDVQGREAAYAVRNWNNVPQWLAAVVDRLKMAQIENRPALEIIQRFNYKNVLIYCDPPYLLSTRSGEAYKHEMTEQDHVELLEALLQHKGTVMLSGYDNPMYREMLKGWTMEQFHTTAGYGAKRIETLWMNFEYQMQFKCSL